MNRIVFGLLGLFLSLGCLAQTKLPPCPNNISYWTDCFGTRDFTYSSYIGEFKDGKFDGQGTETYASGNKYVGEFKNNMRNGQGISYNSRGRITEIGYFENGKLVQTTQPSPPPPPPKPKEIGVVCPTQVAPEMPRRATREGIGGTVRAKLTIEDDGVKLVEILSGPAVFHETVINAIKQYKCISSENIVATQEFVFQLAGDGPLELPNGNIYVGEYVTIDKTIPNGKGFEYTIDGVKVRSGLWEKGNFYQSVEFPTNAPYLFSKAEGLVSVWRNKQEREGLLMVAEIETERKRRLDAERARQIVEQQANQQRQREAEEKLRLAQQQKINSPPVPSASGKRVALIIGNSNYKASPLDNPVNDAKDVAAALRGSGFETQEVLNATKLQMLEATRAFERKVVNSDVALIYYAGHGTEVKGKNYMIPVGANIEREYELSEQAYDAAQWLDMLESAKGTNTKRVNIVILDACRNNALTRGWRSSNAGLARMDAPVGTFLAYSTAPGKVASDGNGRERNSPFAKHLVNAIKQPNMPIEQVFKRVRSAVIDETKGDQIPWDSSSLVGDFFFTVKK